MGRLNYPMVPHVKNASRSFLSAARNPARGTSFATLPIPPGNFRSRYRIGENQL